ncbi:4-fold beta flower protein [Limnohabitans sp.]
MKWVWTWGGEFFGYFEGDNLWTYDGKHIGKIQNGLIYDKNGRYSRACKSGGGFFLSSHF